MSLLVVGALHWDVVVGAPRLPLLDETLRGQGVQYRLGGKGGNQAIAAARAGATVAFAGRIGSDAAGRTMKDRLSEAGVDVSQLQQGAGPSGMSAAIVTETGDYGAVIVSAENLEFDPSKMMLPAGCRAVLLQNEMAPGVLLTCAIAAREAGAKVIWNAAPAQEVTPEELVLVDTLIVNRVEAADLLGRPADQKPLAAVLDLQGLAPKAEVLLTLGGSGVAFAAPGEPPRLQPAEPVKVVSTHGAGDVFAGTFAAHRLQAVSLDQAIAAGQTAAATHIAQSP